MKLAWTKKKNDGTIYFILCCTTFPAISWCASVAIKETSAAVPGILAHSSWAKCSSWLSFEPFKQAEWLITSLKRLITGRALVSHVPMVKSFSISPSGAIIFNHFQSFFFFFLMILLTHNSKAMPDLIHSFSVIFYFLLLLSVFSYFNDHCGVSFIDSTTLWDEAMRKIVRRVYTHICWSSPAATGSARERPPWRAAGSASESCWGWASWGRVFPPCPWRRRECRRAPAGAGRSPPPPWE